MQARRNRPRRGLILVVVLVMVALLALLAASYTFMVSAHLKTVIAQTEQFQARMAAEAGIQRAIAVLRETPGDVDSWFDDPEAYHGALVSGRQGNEGSATFQERSDARTYDRTAEPAWRFTLYAPNFDEPRDARYGFTDECARLDLNVATEAQLRNLFSEVIPQDSDNDVDVDVLVDSLLDWRTAGGGARPQGAKDDYYAALTPPYRAKSALFSTVEELLLVRGFTAWVVFGEDYNQNGLLDPSEDDGDTSFPLDNADGVLFRGVARYLTVWSQDMDTTGENSPRVNLNMQDLDKLRDKLEEAGMDGDLISYVERVRSSGARFNSVMNLIPAPPPPEQEEGASEETSPPPTTQGAGSDATSQPDNENADGVQGGLTDQDGAKDRSENQGTGSPVVYRDLTEEVPPGTYDDLPEILDRLTVNPSPFFQGRINVSTAPREVLALIPGLSAAEADAIAAARKELRSEDKSTPAWLLTQGVLDETKFRQILNQITTKASMYRIESVGYADHIGVISRVMMVIQMRGPIPQVMYYRNLDRLGVAYNPYGAERRELANRSE
jgi:type II secretory pathway component PulK